MKGHIATVHEKKKPYECDICNACFARKYHLKSHVESIHHERKKSRKCSLCNFNCADNRTLKKHIESTHK